ncbi:MAG: ElyC/SanA/YdcF family protein [bacterium]
MRKFFRKILWTLVFLLVITGGAYFLVRQKVDETAAGHIYATTGSLPTGRIGLVLGAQVFPDAVPSKALAYRLQTAVDLYKKGKITGLLMSGDGRSKYYNEVATMKSYALDAGVPATAILTDNDGLRTYSSCYRAKSEFGLARLTVITQPEHLLRTVYTCRSLGIDAVGFASPDIGGSILDRNYAYYYLREKAALVLAWLDVEVIHPAP